MDMQVLAVEYKAGFKMRNIYRNTVVFYLAILLGGCWKVAGPLPDEKYFCVAAGNCSLPEPESGDAALVYIIRPAHLFNTTERHRLYSAQSVAGDYRYIGSLTSSTYCSVYMPEPGVTLRIIGGVKEETLSFGVRNGEVYYVLNKVGINLTKKLTDHLTLVDDTEGEMYLRKVASKCIE
jgi:hypothetical protein